MLYSKDLRRWWCILESSGNQMQKNPSSRRIASRNNWRQVSGCRIQRADLHLLLEDLPLSSGQRMRMEIG
eukprot:3817327-Amphidinium_carterae.1